MSYYAEEYNPENSLKQQQTCDKEPATMFKIENVQV